MAPSCPQPALPTLLVLLQALLPGPGNAQTSVFPPEVILPRGGSVVVNCSASCDQPILLGMETPLPKKEILPGGNNWKMYELSNVQEDSQPMCYSNCPDGQSSAKTFLTVYWTPERVELAPLPSWQPVGKNLTLRCQVEGGAPRANLTVVLLRGEKELSRQSAVGEPAEVTTTVPVSRDDHGANFSCRTELDLRSCGLGLFENTSAPQQLQTFDLPATPPQLVSPQVLEVDTQGTVVCSLDGLFPVSEAQVYLALGDQKLNPTITYGNNSLSAKASVKVTAEEEGTQRLLCSVMLGTQTQETRQTVTIYSFPAPNVILTEPEVSEGTEVTVKCEAHSTAKVTLNGVPAQPPGPRAELLLKATPEDNGRSFSCSATLEVAGQLVHKNQTRQLRVLYGPRLDEKDCPGNWTWPENSQQTPMCQAWGNPLPQLKCLKDGTFPLPIGKSVTVTRDLAGTYLCQARSTRGEVTREVTVNVLSPQYEMVIITVVAAAVILGMAGVATYLYNRQRKIRKYRLQQAQNGTPMKANTQATPP
ncbi:PREDICTED: intercellular adhesion molecule 1 [Colobus angolensis palliatus]|uniref:Intercellular adhesion molecule 1 n=1 Tax=Colobus angolensis palliatus TaxID=336983 RepID=A0A2K5JRA2_COLAP|nr:PREDICTED: intercellular adhesion molecule 1 [Colobus angolensis palliatus]